MCEKKRSALGRILPGIALASCLSACAGSPPPVIGRAQSEPVAALGQTGYTANRSNDSTLHPSDVISVSVFREPDLSVAKVRIAPDGTVSLPLVGAVQAAGLTQQQLAGTISAKLAEGYLKSPAVTVSVDAFDSHRVTVEGSVTTPGVYAYPEGARLSDAMALAAGPTRVAKLSEVVIFRDKPDGTYVARFDYAAVSSGQMLDPTLQPGDRVVVGLSQLSQFWQDFLRTVPLIAVFQRF